MSVVISSSYVIPLATGADVLDGRNPVIGYNNLATTSSISTTTQNTAYPRTNLANPSTNLHWRGTSMVANEFITLGNVGVADIDYIGVAKHNWGSAGIAVSVEYLDADLVTWVELIASVLLANDGPALFRFPKLAYAGLRLKLQPGSAVPRASVLYYGELLQVQRRVYVGHTPINYNVQTRAVNGKAESGDFLSRIVLSETVKTQLSLKELTALWVREKLVPFLVHARDKPFFFAWRPSEYPQEVGYCWMTNDPAPQNTRGTGYMQLTLEMNGVA